MYTSTIKQFFRYFAIHGPKIQQKMYNQYPFWMYMVMCPACYRLHHLGVIKMSVA